MLYQNMVYILKTDLRLIPFLIILDFMSISEFIFYIFMFLFYTMRKHTLTAYFVFVIARNIYLKEEEYSNVPTSQYFAQFNTTSR